MSWQEIRAELAKLFADVAIEDPPAKVARVYEEPPASIEVDEPCVVIFPPKRTVTERSYGARTVQYTVTCLLLLRDEDAEVAARMVDAFAEAVLDPFDGAVALHGVANAWLLSQTVEAPRGDLKYAGTSYVGFDCIVVVGDLQQKEFAP